MVLVGYGQELHHSFVDFGNCGESQYLTMLVPLNVAHGASSATGVICSAVKRIIFP